MFYWEKDTSRRLIMLRQVARLNPSVLTSEPEIKEDSVEYPYFLIMFLDHVLLLRLKLYISKAEMARNLN